MRNIPIVAEVGFMANEPINEPYAGSSCQPKDTPLKQHDQRQTYNLPQKRNCPIAAACGYVCQQRLDAPCDFSV